MIKKKLFVIIFKDHILEKLKSLIKLKENTQQEQYRNVKLLIYQGNTFSKN